MEVLGLEPLGGVERRAGERSGVEQREQGPAPAAEERRGEEKMEVDREGQEQPDDGVEDDRRAAGVPRRGEPRGQEDGGGVAEEHEHSQRSSCGRAGYERRSHQQNTSGSSAKQEGEGDGGRAGSRSRTLEGAWTALAAAEYPGLPVVRKGASRSSVRSLR